MSAKVDAIMDEERETIVFTGHTYKAFNTAITDFNLVATQLRMLAGGQPLWHFTIKNHALCHCALQSGRLNPRCGI
eukprot:1608155-Amphidinium_carterae.1